MTLADLHPVIQTTVLHLAHSNDWSLAKLGEHFGISKQAVHKRLAIGKPLLAKLLTESVEPPEAQKLLAAEREIERLRGLLKSLRMQLVLHAAVIFMLICLKNRIQDFFSKFKLTRLKPEEKKRVLDLWVKFEKLGGSLKVFAASVERSPDTIGAWLEAFRKYGMAGLVDKRTMPKSFGHKLPLWLRDQIVSLFLRFPKWTEYQYHKYMMMNPAINFCVSLPTIKKLKAHYAAKSAEEIARQKKLWAFDASTDVWTVDFTCLLKTDNYKLQLLTVSDQRSRFLLDTALFLETSTAQVLDHLMDLFSKYGKPLIIKADNGPEFRLDCRAGLEQAAVYLLNSPPYYGQFCGAHERIHRSLKTYIDDFSTHRNLQRLVADTESFRNDHNHHWPLEILGMKTPAQIFYSDEDFVRKDVEVVKPYEKDGELRMKFKNRDGKPARISIPVVAGASTQANNDHT